MASALLSTLAPASTAAAQEVTSKAAEVAPGHTPSDGPSRPAPRLPGAVLAQAGNCFTDPAGDVVDDSQPPQPLDEPRADVVEHCVDYGQDLTFSARVTQPTDPSSDPAWEFETGVVFFVDTTGDSQFDYSVELFRFEQGVTANVFDNASPQPNMVCQATPAYDGTTHVVSGVAPDCIGSPQQIWLSTGFIFQETAEAPVAFDIAPDNFAFDGPVVPSDGGEPPPPSGSFQCPGPPNPVDDDGIAIARIACGNGDGTTTPIAQAIAMSEVVFSEAETSPAQHVIIARDDAFPDALSGSALSFGVAPILYTYSPASVPGGLDANTLAPETEQELLRVLPPGGTVYLLGGTAALAGGLDAYITDLGYVVRRFAGANRIDTAAQVAPEVRAIVDRFEQIGFPDLNSVIVTTANNWVDAVAAGQLSAYFGLPVLLTNKGDDTTSGLTPETRNLLQSLAPDFIYILGGTGVISRETAIDVAQYAKGGECPGIVSGAEAPGQAPATCWYQGANRYATAFSAGQVNRNLVRFTDNEFTPADAVFAIAVQLDAPLESNMWAHVLSASPLAGANAAVFLPACRDCNPPDSARPGSQVPPDTVTLICGYLPADLSTIFLAGDRDILSDAGAQEMRALVRKQGCPS